MLPIIALDFKVATLEDVELLTNMRMAFAQEYHGPALEDEILKTQSAIHDYIIQKMSEHQYLGYLASYQKPGYRVGGDTHLSNLTHSMAYLFYGNAKKIAIPDFYLNV